MFINWRPIVVIVTCMLISSHAMAQKVFRWTDAEGIVHYGDEPPANARRIQDVEIYPGPTPAQIQQAQEVAETTRKAADAYTSERLQREAEAQARRKALAEKKQQETKAQKTADE